MAGDAVAEEQVSSFPVTVRPFVRRLARGRMPAHGPPASPFPGALWEGGGRGPPTGGAAASPGAGSGPGRPRVAVRPLWTAAGRGSAPLGGRGSGLAELFGQLRSGAQGGRGVGLR